MKVYFTSVDCLHMYHREGQHWGRRVNFEWGGGISLGGGSLIRAGERTIEGFDQGERENTVIWSGCQWRLRWSTVRVTEGRQGQVRGGGR